MADGWILDQFIAFVYRYQIWVVIGLPAWIMLFYVYTRDKTSTDFDEFYKKWDELYKLYNNEQKRIRDISYVVKNLTKSMIDDGESECNEKRNELKKNMEEMETFLNKNKRFYLYEFLFEREGKYRSFYVHVYLVFMSLGTYAMLLAIFFFFYSSEEVELVWFRKNVPILVFTIWISEFIMKCMVCFHEKSAVCRICMRFVQTILVSIVLKLNNPTLPLGRAIACWFAFYMIGGLVHEQCSNKKDD